MAVAKAFLDAGNVVTSNAVLPTGQKRNLGGRESIVKVRRQHHVIVKLYDFDQTWHIRFADNPDQKPMLQNSRPMRKLQAFALHSSATSRNKQMHKPIVRVYHEAEAGRVIHSKRDSKAENERVTVRAGDVLAWLADAANEDCSWLADFADDEVTVSIDLYEVIQAYRHFRRSA